MGRWTKTIEGLVVAVLLLTMVPGCDDAANRTKIDLNGTWRVEYSPDYYGPNIWVLTVNESEVVGLLSSDEPGKAVYQGTLYGEIAHDVMTFDIEWTPDELCLYTGDGRAALVGDFQGTYIAHSGKDACGTRSPMDLTFTADRQ